MNARGFTLIEIIVTIILMAIMGFMAAQLIATTLRGSAESAGQIKDLTEATSTLEECIAYLNTEAMQQKAASDLITDKGLEALLEAQSSGNCNDRNGGNCGIRTAAHPARTTC